MADVHKNWNHSAVSRPNRTETPATPEEVRDFIASAPDLPVRAAGHWHSLNDCVKADGGTQLLMDRFTDDAQAIRRGLDPANGTVTVRAGTSLFAIAHTLLPDFQLPVMPEIGNATAGSVACCGTKDSSLGKGPGQVSSAVVAMKIATPHGIETVTEAQDPERMRLLRCSYGLLGIVLEVTFRIEPVQVVEFDFEKFELTKLPPLAEIQGSADGFLAFLEPFNDTVLVERRKVDRNPARPLTPGDRLQCAWRSLLWETVGSGAASVLSDFPLSGLLQHLLARKPQSLIGKALLDQLLAVGLGPLHFRARRADTMIEFEADRPDYFDFTFWAFPVRQWETLVPEYLSFCKGFLKRTGFRPSLPTEIYRIARDDKSLLSVSHEADVFTLDMVHHRRQGEEFDELWLQMNREFNVFAAEHGGRPLLNQTKQLTRDVMATVLEQSPGLVAGWNTLRSRAEPRLTSAYFAGLF